ncbi:MAG: hypothetical protein MUO17_02120 [Dehalococcoidales bacterium]|nr:hypothetical protein [Dehalococcoidales bacterium]
MSNAILGNTVQINNHELTKIVDLVTEIAKVSSVQALNSRLNPDTYKFRPVKTSGRKGKATSYPSIASIVADRFDKLDPALHKSVRLNLGRDESLTKSIRSLGINIESSQSVFDQIDLRTRFNFINDQTFNDVTVPKMLSECSGIQALPVSLPVNGNGPANTGVNFRIYKVTCVDETDPENGGHDKISWGGAATNDKGEASIIPEYRVSDGFDDGDVVSFPPTTLKTFNFTDNAYPKSFSVMLTLAEIDWGGFGTYIADLYASIRTQVTAILSALGTAAGAWIGAQIGGTVGTAIAGPLGAIIGIIAGAILGALITWLSQVFNDDVFPAQASAIVLNTSSDTFGGSLVSPRMYFPYSGFGGEYQVEYDWQIVRPYDGPTIVNVNPSSGHGGETLSVTITGTKFTGATGVFFFNPTSSSAIVNSFHVDSSTQITANIVLPANVFFGLFLVSVVSPHGMAPFFHFYVV